MVCAVVCTAPLTMPSAIPRCTIMVPKYETSVTVSVATCDGHALVRAEPGVLLRRTSPTSSRVVRRHDRRRGDVRPRARRAFARMIRLVAEQGQVGDVQPQQDRRRPQDALVLALRQHHVPAIRPGPLDQPVLEHHRRHHVRIRRRRSRPAARRVSTASAKARSAVSSFTGGVRGQPAAHPASVVAVSKVPPARHQDRQVLLDAVDQLLRSTPAACSRRSARSTPGSGRSPTDAPGSTRAARPTGRPAR